MPIDSLLELLCAGGPAQEPPAARLTLIDVRSPTEFAQGHIPQAVNVPLFTDDQRAAVGTCYKQSGRQAAVLLGLELVGPRMRGLVESVESHHEPGRPLWIHCWRGGMRSQSVAWLLRQAGLEVTVLAGGYKQYRRAAQASFLASFPLVVLSGMTGAGKTNWLHALRDEGEQVLDLESLAHHRGSSFGGIGLPPQPTCEQFENRLFEQLRGFDPQRVIWVEDESPSIGRVRVPHEFWWSMRRSPAVFLDVPANERAKNLAAEYGALDRSELAAAIGRLEKKLGSVQTASTLRQLASGELETVAASLLHYYDRTYTHAARRRPRHHVVPLASPISVSQLRATGHACSEHAVPVSSVAASMEVR